MNAKSSGPARIIARIAALLTIASLLTTFGLAAAAHTPAANDLLATRYFDSVIEDGSLQSASTLVAANAVLHTPEGTFVGPQGANDFATDMNATFANLDFQVKSIEVAGDTLVMPFTLIGINVASYEGRTVNCAGVAVPGVAVITFAGGTIAEQWISYDQAMLRSQIDAFNLIDAALRPGCATQLQPVAQAVATADAALPPSCLGANLCELPY